MKSMATALIVASLALPAVAAEIPLPRQKPPRVAIGDVAMIAIPVPRRKPQRGETAEPPDSLERSVPTGPWPKSSGKWPRETVAAERRICNELLSQINAEWRPLEPIGRDGGCGIAAPVEITSLAGAEITPPATLNCRMAAALHDWIRNSLQPAARSKLKSRIARIQNASSYACRLRNNSKRGKISQHAFGNAFDISEFDLAKGGETTVKGDWSGLFQTVGISSRGNFLRAIRKSACDYFTTVLGPGSDRAHGDHFHVDLTQRRNGGKVCR
jgi:hypothetical protein